MTLLELSPDSIAPAVLKSCCAAVYESEWARLLLGESFHPGGLALTERLGTLLALQPGQRVLDVAAGQGSSAIFLAQKFGCDVVGVDYSAEIVAQANAAAANAGLAERVRFVRGDAEQLQFDDESFDALVCECAFCTFPDKPTAAHEFARVLRPAGRLGLSDLTRSGPLPEILTSLLAWVACIADARPLDEYAAHLQQAGLTIEHAEPHNEALSAMIHDIRGKLVAAELLVKLKKVDLPQADFELAKRMVRAAKESVQQDRLGYAIIVGTKQP